MNQRTLAHIRMWPRRIVAQLVLLLIALSLTSCVVPEALIVQPPEPAVTPPSVPVPAPAPQDARAAISPHLAAALAHAPAATSILAFTDWSLLKHIAGVPELTSADSLEDRMSFMRRVGVEEQAIASGFGLNYFMTHAEMWGWDSTDLVWEADLSLDGPPTWVLRFRDDFDFVPVLARLDERGYTKTTYGGVTLYSHVLDLKVDWVRSTEFGVLNIAFLEDEKSFVLASTPEAVTNVLDTIAQGATMANQPAMRSVAAALGEVGAAILAPDGCAMLDPTPTLGSSSAAIEAILKEIEQTGITHAYSVFGFGYQVASIEGEALPLGIFVHHYANAAHAQTDLESRRQVATAGNSLARRVPYAELFEVVDAQVIADGSGANLVLRLHALGRAPRLFISMIYQRDLLFSACGSHDSAGG